MHVISDIHKNGPIPSSPTNWENFDQFFVEICKIVSQFLNSCTATHISTAFLLAVIMMPVNSRMFHVAGYFALSIAFDSVLVKNSEMDTFLHRLPSEFSRINGPTIMTFQTVISINTLFRQALEQIGMQITEQHSAVCLILLALYVLRHMNEYLFYIVSFVLMIHPSVADGILANMGLKGFRVSIFTALIRSCWFTWSHSRNLFSGVYDVLLFFVLNIISIPWIILLFQQAFFYPVRDNGIIEHTFRITKWLRVSSTERKSDSLGSELSSIYSLTLILFTFAQALLRLHDYSRAELLLTFIWLGNVFFRLNNNVLADGIPKPLTDFMRPITQTARHSPLFVFLVISVSLPMTSFYISWMHYVTEWIPWIVMASSENISPLYFVPCVTYLIWKHGILATFGLIRLILLRWVVLNRVKYLYDATDKKVH